MSNLSIFLRAIIMQDLKQKWVNLNEEYDTLILDVLNGKKLDVPISRVKKIQKELFELESEIFERT